VGASTASPVILPCSRACEGCFINFVAVQTDEAERKRPSFEFESGGCEREDRRTTDDRRKKILSVRQKRRRRKAERRRRASFLFKTLPSQYVCLNARSWQRSFARTSLFPNPSKKKRGRQRNHGRTADVPGKQGREKGAEIALETESRVQQNSI